MLSFNAWFWLSLIDSISPMKYLLCMPYHIAISTLANSDNAGIILAGSNNLAIVFTVTVGTKHYLSSCSTFSMGAFPYSLTNMMV